MSEQQKQIKSSKRKRIQLDFSENAFEKLEELREMAACDSVAETVRNALRLYSWFLDQRAKGWRLQLSRENVIREVELLFDDDLGVVMSRKE